MRFGYVTCFVLLAASALAFSPTSARADGCDGTGRYRFLVEWQEATCRTSPNDDPMDVLVERGAGASLLVAKNGGLLGGTAQAKAEGGACKLQLEMDVNQTAWGDPDIAHWSVLLVEKNNQLRGNGTVSQTEGTGRKRKCLRRFVLSGSKGGAAVAPEAEVGIKEVAPDKSAAEIAAALRSEIERRRDPLDACYRGARDGGVPARAWLKVKFVVQKNGEAVSTLVMDSVKEPAVVECMMTAVRAFKLPPPGAPVVEYTHAFSFPRLMPSAPPAPAPSPPASPPPDAGTDARRN